ncbi:DNA-processing protein DprA [Agaribacter flavus]|uniref:DNA-processing protein DprA n=1 Tax=Agaribacter flavus TaxID=1902781 RepID=A0ABV7FTG6_9ALTE
MHTTETIDDIHSWLRLACITKMGFARLSKTAEALRTPLHTIHKTNHDQLLQLGWQVGQIDAVKGRCAKTEHRIKKAIKWLESTSRRHVLHIGHPDYPKALLDTASPPIVLFAEGKLDLLNYSMLAMVGTRSPTQYAYDVAESLLPAFYGYADFATISGLALGVDAICHRTSLAHGIPTVAVLGCGIDLVYPKRHQQLQQDIAASGLLLSEFFPGVKPQAFNFPRRNRLISALSDAVLISEGRIKSGTMVTVKYAIEQNKEVLVVPSSIFNPNGELALQLIKDGATPVTSASDIVEAVPAFHNFALNINNSPKNADKPLASDPLLDSVDASGTSVDVIAKRSGMSVVDVLTQLLEYELRGLVSSTAEGYVKLRG